MKVFILVDQIKKTGGIERLVVIKANYWSKVFNYDVSIITTEQENVLPVYNLEKDVQLLDLNIKYGESLSYFHPLNWKNIINNILKIKKIINQHRPDYIIVAPHIPATYFLPFIKGKTKIIKEFHFTKFYKKSSIKNKLFEWIEAKYNKLVVLSNEEKKYYPANNTIVIPNPIEYNRVSTTPIDQKQFIALAILRFAPVKQIDKMVCLWESFYKSNPRWQLHIYGKQDDLYFPPVEKLVKEKNLEETIIFKGETKDVSEALESGKVLLMTSSQECFPMVILEAMAHGVPTISFDSPTGPRNIISHQEDGIIVPLNNINKFVSELTIFSNNISLQKYLSQNAKLKAQKFEINQIMKEWKDKIFEL